MGQEKEQNAPAIQVSSLRTVGDLDGKAEETRDPCRFCGGTTWRITGEYDEVSCDDCGRFPHDLCDECGASPPAAGGLCEGCIAYKEHTAF